MRIHCIITPKDDGLDNIASLGSTIWVLYPTTGYFFFRLKLLIQRFILIFIFQQLLLVSPTHTFEEILEECSLKLELNAKALYTAQGALVDNVVFIRCELQFFIC